MKQLLVVFALLSFVPEKLSAQEKQLVITYKFEQKHLRLGGKNNSVILKSNRPTYNVKVYSFGNVSIRETEPNIFINNDTIYNYIKVDNGKALMLEPVFLVGSAEFGIGYKNLLKEPLNLFGWKLNKRSKTILGYQCNEASCTFRGRDYVAYFTREIPFKTAPWKFHGLPGVVLEVYSTDEFCKWTAESLEIKTYKKEIDLPYDGLEIVHLELYINMLKEKKRQLIEISKKNRLNHPKAQSYHNTVQGILTLPNTIEIFDLE